MGIYDRDYYRASQGEGFFRGATGVKWIVIATAAVFVAQLFGKTPDQARFARPDADDDTRVLERFSPEGPVTRALEYRADLVVWGQVWRLLTYALLHSTVNIFHIAVNLFLLWWAGTEVEHMYGRREFLGVYVLGALAGGLGEFLADAAGLTHWGRPMVGASGAVMTVLVLFACHFPDRQLLFFGFLPISAWLLVLLYLAQDALTLMNMNEGGVAVAAHLGGAAWGFLYYRANVRVSDWLPDTSRWAKAKRRPPLRVYREEDGDRPAPPTAVASSAGTDARLEEELDAVLEKVKRLGKDSLSARETDVLMRASEIYKRRRR